MLLSESKAQKLINTIQNANVIHLVDSDDSFDVNDDGSVVHQKMEQWARVTFPVHSSSFYDLFENFKAEYTSNRLIIGFNAEVYNNPKISQCASIKEYFYEIIINGIGVRVRKDAIFKHYQIGMVNTHLNSEGNPYYTQNPISLKSAPWNELNPKIIAEISDYFAYQETVLDTIIKYLRTGIQAMKIPRQYRTTYLCNYFKFDMNKLGIKEEAEDNINAFFNELIEKKYVDSESLKSLVDFFSDNHSQTKVRWLQTKTDLWYLINRMVKKGYLENPKRVTAKIICKVFTSANGVDFVPEDFASLHEPKNIKELNDLLAILGSSGR